MAHSLSAKKRIRQNAKRRMRNRAHRSTVRTQIKSFLQTVKDIKDVAELEKAYITTQKKIDKLAASGIMHKNTAARKKAQLAKLLNTAKAKLA